MEAQAAGLDRKRTRDEEDDTSVPYSPDREESPEAKRLRDDLLDILDDDDGAVDRNPTTVGELDSVLRSLEKEIGLTSSSPTSLGEQQHVSPAQPWCSEADWDDTAAGICSGQNQQSELGFLLEASDDELGLPPSGPSTSEEEGQQQFEDETASSVFLPVDSGDAVGLGSQIWGFEDDVPSPYEGFGFGYPGDNNGIHGAGDSAPLSTDGVSGDGSLLENEDGVLFHAGLFDDDDFSDAGANSDLLWRQETLPAL